MQVARSKVVRSGIRGIRRRKGRRLWGDGRRPWIQPQISALFETRNWQLPRRDEVARREAIAGYMVR